MTSLAVLHGVDAVTVPVPDLDAQHMVDVVEVPDLNKFDHSLEAHEVSIGSFGQVLSERVVFMGDDPATASNVGGPRR